MKTQVTADSLKIMQGNMRFTFYTYIYKYIYIIIYMKLKDAYSLEEKLWQT